MGSTRLPGKVLADLCGRPMLSRQLERLRRCREADALVVAIPDDEAQAPLAALVASEPGVQLVRGPEHDVLARYRAAAVAAGAGIVVRVTSDCPLIEPAVVDRCLSTFRARPDADYVSNVHLRTYPRGLDTEVFGRDLLELAFREATTTAEREHVTPFIYRQPERFKLVEVTHDEDLNSERWTVDTPEDLDFVRRIYGALYDTTPDFVLEDVLAVLAQHPEWREINRGVTQKPVAP